jgi:hypothetical protein
MVIYVQLNILIRILSRADKVGMVKGGSEELNLFLHNLSHVSFVLPREIGAANAALSYRYTFDIPL